jgi:hypothetical protein
MQPAGRAFAGELGVAVAGSIAIGLPFVAFTRLVLFHFYVRGSFLLDSGLLASLLWHSDAALTQPESLGGASFFATHMSPLFLLVSAISRVLPFSLPQFFAGFIGFSHALLALAVFWLLVEGFGLRRGAAPWLAALAALGFAFSGLAMAIARYPHFETLIAAFFLLFAVAQALGHTKRAALFFVLGLATREDAGLHYFAVLSLLVALNVISGMPLRQQRRELAFASAALLYAIAVIALQHLAFPGASAFARVYLGDPPLAHLTTSLMADRLLYFALNRPYILLPALGACIWASRARNPYVVLGYAACIPWLLLHLLASSSFAGLLFSYYAFPFLIALAWPLLAVFRQRPGPSSGPAAAIVGFAALLALSFMPGADARDPGPLGLPEAFRESPSWAQQRATDRAIAAISAARPTLGRLLVADSVAAIAPNAFTPEEIPFLQGRDDVPDQNMARPDTVAFMTEGFDAAKLSAIATAAGLVRRYAVPGTALHLASRRKLEDVPALAGVVAAE